MNSLGIILLFLTNYCSYFGNGHLLQDVKTDDVSRTITDDNELRFPCPVPTDIVPCICSESSSGLILNCDGIESDAQLATVFQATFPVKDFFRFEVTNNQAITSLNHGLHNLTFEQIYFYNQPSNLEYISDYFLLETKESLTFIHLHDTLLNEDTFPFTVLESLPNLQYLDIDSGYTLSEIPPIASQSLIKLEFDGNIITDLNPGTFDNIPFLDTFILDLNQLTRLKQNSLKITPLTTLISINRNAINVTEPGAFVIEDGASDSVTIDLSNNQIKEIPENAWGSVFPHLKELIIYGNPLTCGCEIAWIVINSDYLSKIDGEATCTDGQKVIELDPIIYLTYCI